MRQSRSRRAPSRTSARVERSLGAAVLRLLDGEPVAVRDLATQERSARRLLDGLSDLRLTRTHGGIAPAAKYFHESQRLKWNDEKNDIARTVVSKLDPVSPVAAFTGTLVAKVIEEMHHQNIAPVVITNSLAVLDSVPQAPQVHVVGGQYDANIHGLVGQEASESFAKRSYGQGLLGLSGLQIDAKDQVQLYVRHPAEVPVLQTMLNHVTDQVVIVANIQKFGRTDSWQFATLQELLLRVRVILVTNDVEQWRAELESQYERAKKTVEKLTTMTRDLDGFKLSFAQRDQ